MPADLSYHITREGESLGEMSLEEIQAALDAGSLRPDDFGWREDMEEWLPLSEIVSRTSVSTGTTPPKNQLQIKGPRPMQLSRVQEGSSKGRSNLGPGLLSLDTPSAFESPKPAKTTPLLSGASLSPRPPAEPGFSPHPPQRTRIGGKPSESASPKPQSLAEDEAPKEPEAMPWAPQPMRKPPKPARSKGPSGILRLLLLTAILGGILYWVYYKYYGFRISIEPPPAAAESKARK
ncbi:MAG TPA: GYF domain-containing protein [Prosthecobacter sp.]